MKIENDKMRGFYAGLFAGMLAGLWFFLYAYSARAINIQFQKLLLDSFRLR
jgi:hypothetical protein